VQRLFWIALCLLLSFLPAAAEEQRTSAARLPEIAVSQLPAEARQTITLVRKGGPYPYERDGIVFGNFEKLLPARERGYYREYTVPTPGVKSRGARRIVAGKGGELYYTGDHYKSFRRVRE
jgi:ribonuclease T1